MLDVEVEGQKEKILLVDLHTHLGKEQVLDPSGTKAYRTTTLRDLVEFYEKVGYELVRRSHGNLAFAFGIASPGKPSSYLIQKIVEKTQSGQISGWLLDHGVTFPFNDALAARTTPQFQKPNDRVLLRTREPQYGRIIAFCRVDPFDGRKSQEEVKRCVQLGARGLKLHPLSQGFIGKIKSGEVIDLLELSASLNIPVIFDVANPGVGEDVGIAVEETKSRLGPGSNLKVILGHFGFAYSSEIMHDLIQRPEFVTELSGCRGEDVSFFFEKLIDHAGLAGINKISYASDYNYFGVPQCADFISYVLSKDFQELVGEEHHLEYSRKILGLNALSLFPVGPNPSPSSKKVNGVWMVPTNELADQIIGALKDRRVAIRPILISIEEKGEITAWNIQKPPDISCCSLVRSQKDVSWVLMSDQISESKNLEKSLQTLRSIESNDALEKFDLQNFIAP